MDRLRLDGVISCSNFFFAFRSSKQLRRQAAEKGEVNLPQNLPISCAVIAEAKGISLEEAARATRRNAQRLFFGRELEDGDGET